MRIKVLLLFALVTAVMFTGCAAKKDVQKNITLSAAISLKEPLEEIIADYQKNNNVKVNVNYGGSGTLQKQIEEGAPVDIFISAGKTQMDKLQAEKLLDNSTRENLLENNLVLISQRSSGDIKSLEELGTKKVSLAIGELSTVPAGQYAKESLKKTGLWDKVSGNLVYGKDVKDVLNYVKQGEVQAGIVYGSDAVGLDNSYNIVKIPEDSHSPIIYPVAVINSSKNTETAKDFIKFLKTSKSKNIFNKYKFAMEQ